MSNIVFAAGTVDCVYPRPVEVTDTFTDLASFFESEGSKLFVKVGVTNAYDADGNYVKAQYGDYTENDGSDCYGNLSWDNLYEYAVTKRYSTNNRLIDIRERNLMDLIYSMSEKGVKGTLNVSFYDSIYQHNCVKRFKLILQ